MSKVPFTSEGVTQKQTELNQLPEEELITQSDLIASDPKNWIIESFILSNEQQAYLNGLPEIETKTMGWSLAYSVLGKIAINMQDSYTTNRCKCIK